MTMTRNTISKTERLIMTICNISGFHIEEYKTTHSCYFTGSGGVFVLAKPEACLKEGKMIVSASRRTDLPNYYGDWFYQRIREGYVLVRNPMNPRQISRILLTPELVDCIVFWTKNPVHMMGRLDELEAYSYYFQFTLNGYGKEIEPGLPETGALLETFCSLSEKLGKERVVWRYDPVFFSEAYTFENHVEKFGRLAEALAGHTERVVISFLDVYVKIKKKMEEAGIREPEPEDARRLAGEMARIAGRYGLRIESCAERIALQDVGVAHGSCIDRKLIERVIGCRLKGKKDKNQRQECGCMESIDIGAYDTCGNGCRYCYANSGSGSVDRSRARFNPSAPILCGAVGPEERVTERKTASQRDNQLDFLDLG